MLSTNPRWLGGLAGARVHSTSARYSCNPLARRQIRTMSQPAIDLGSLRRLPVPERLQLVEDIWDSIAVETPAPDLPLTPALLSELDRRVKDLDEGREPTFSWDEVRERVFRDKLHGP